MIKSEVVASIAKHTGLSKADVRLVLDTLFATIKSQNAFGEPVHFRGFGSFAAKRRAKRIARHIRRNTALAIEAHYVPAFYPSKTFSNQIKTALAD